MLKIVKELLESGAINQEVADKFEGEWKNHTKILNDENKDLRTKNENLTKSYEQLAESNKTLDERLAGIDDEIKQAKLDGKNELVSQLEAERTEKAELQKNLENFRNENQKLTIDSGISKALSDFDVLDSEVVSNTIRLNTIIGDDGKLMYKQGDGVVPLNDGVTSFFETKPNLLKAKGNTGSGAGGNGLSHDQNANLENLSPSQKMAQGRK